MVICPRTQRLPLPSSPRLQSVIISRGHWAAEEHAMSGFTLLGRLCVCPHGHGSWCNCVPSAGPAHGLSRAGAVCVRGQCGRQMIHLTKNNRTFRLTCASIQPRHWYMYHENIDHRRCSQLVRLARALSPQSPRRREPEPLARSAPRANCVLGSGSLPLD